MGDFDFFGTDDQAEEEVNSNELELFFDFDYENLLNDGIEKNVKLCASVRPSDDLRRSFEKMAGGQNTHICLLLDVSGSMFKVLQPGSKAYPGRIIYDYQDKAYRIEDITKFDVAVESAKRIVDLLRDGDTLTCIIYSVEALVLFDNKTRTDRSEILNKLSSINKCGNETNISKALLMADVVLSRFNDALPKRVLFFTDGEPTEEESKGIGAGQILADHNIAVESMGFGKDDVNFPYLQKISSFSGGITTLISYPDEFASVFASMFEQSQSIIVTNVKLVLRLTSGTRILDYYRGTPDNVYLGNREGVDEKILELNLGQIEKNQMYKYYFNVKLPGVEDDYEGPINTMSAELHFFVPGKHNDEEQVVKVNVPINYTSDEDEADEINGDVNILFRLAEVKRFDEEREKAFNAGDTNGTIKWIKKIIDVYKELQKPVEAQAYTDMLEQYMKTNSISKAILNKATSSSSQAQETGILDDLEDEEKSKFANRLKNRRRR